MEVARNEDVKIGWSQIEGSIFLTKEFDIYSLGNWEIEVV